MLKTKQIEQKIDHGTKNEIQKLMKWHAPVYMVKRYIAFCRHALNQLQFLSDQHIPLTHRECSPCTDKSWEPPCLNRNRSRWLDPAVRGLWVDWVVFCVVQANPDWMLFTWRAPIAFSLFPPKLRLQRWWGVHVATVVLAEHKPAWKSGNHSKERNFAQAHYWPTKWLTADLDGMLLKAILACERYN